MGKYLILIMISILIPISFIYAHPGNKDSSGGHTCYTNCAYYGLTYGQYHFNNSPKTTPITQTTNNIPYVWHGINYQGTCSSYELYYSEYDKNAKKYFSSVEYMNEKEIWRKKLKTKDGDFLKKWGAYGKTVNGVDYESFVSQYESLILNKTTDLDDTDCFMPFPKLSEYANSQIQAYNKEQGLLKNKIKRIFSWL